MRRLTTALLLAGLIVSCTSDGSEAPPEAIEAAIAYSVFVDPTGEPEGTSYEVIDSYTDGDCAVVVLSDLVRDTSHFWYLANLNQYPLDDILEEHHPPDEWDLVIEAVGDMEWAPVVGERHSNPTSSLEEYHDGYPQFGNLCILVDPD